MNQQESMSLVDVADDTRWEGRSTTRCFGNLGFRFQGLGFTASSGAKPEQLPAVRPRPLTTLKMWIECGSVSCALAMDSHCVMMCGMRTIARMPRFSHPRPKRPATTQTFTRQALNSQPPGCVFHWCPFLFSGSKSDVFQPCLGRYPFEASFFCFSLFVFVFLFFL